jgi:hypothetical protein
MLQLGRAILGAMGTAQMRAALGGLSTQGVMGLATASSPQDAKPKGLLSPANFYVREQLKPYQEQHKVDSKTALGIISSHWRNLTPEQKARYEEMARQQPGFVERTKASKQEKARPLSAYNIFFQAKLKVSKQPIALGPAEGFPFAFQSWSTCNPRCVWLLLSATFLLNTMLALLHRALQHLKDGGMKHADAFKLVGKEWKGMSDEQKRPFMQAHEKAVKEWEQRTGKQFKKDSK